MTKTTGTVNGTEVWQLSASARTSPRKLARAASSEPLQRGFPVQDYDISADGQRVVMWTTGRDGKSQFLAGSVGS